MRTRVGAVILKDKKVLLMHRIKNEKEYYVIPGGSLESNETIIEACHREIKEETNLDINIIKEAFRILNEGKKEIYFLAEPKSSNLKLGGPEVLRESANNRYILEWVDILEISKLNLMPPNIKDELLKAYLLQ